MLVSKSDLRARIKLIREELDSRHKFGSVKLSESKGIPLPADKLQKELFSLLYKLSKIE